MLPVTDRIRDEELLDATEHHDVASTRLVHLVTIEAEKTVQLAELAAADLAVRARNTDSGVGRRPAAGDPADAQHAHVGVVIETRDLKLQGAFRVHDRRPDVLDYRLEERRHVARTDVGLQARVTVEGRGVDHGEIELRVGGA